MTWSLLKSIDILTHNLSKKIMHQIRLMNMIICRMVNRITILIYAVMKNVMRERKIVAKYWSLVSQVYLHSYSWFSILSINTRDIKNNNLTWKISLKHSRLYNKIMRYLRNNNNQRNGQNKTSEKLMTLNKISHLELNRQNSYVTISRVIKQLSARLKNLKKVLLLIMPKPFLNNKIMNKQCRKLMSMTYH